MAEEGVAPNPITAADFSLRRIGRAVGLLAVAALVGQVITVVRELFVASEVGASAQLDAVLVAITAPVLIAGILSSGVRAALVPAHIDMETRRGTAAAQRLLGGLIGWVLLVAAALTALLALFPEPAVTIAGPGLSPEAHAEAVAYARVVSPLLLFGTLQHVMSAVCQIHDRFTPIAAASILGPIVSLIGTVGLWPALGLAAFPVSLVLGQIVAAAALVVIAAFAGMLPRPSLRVEPGATREFIRHAGPLAAGSAFLQFNLLSDRAVASLVGVGSVSALRYGQQIVIEPLGAIVLGWSTVIYPALVRRAMTTTTGLGESLARAARASLALSAPVGLWMAAVAPLIVELVYLRGAFDAEDVALTTAVVVGFSPMIILTAVQPVLTGAHNARRHAMLLGGVAVANAILNLVLNVVFAVTLGIGGIALSTSVTVLILLLFLAIRLSEPGFVLSDVLRYTLRALVASAIVVVPSLVATQFVPSGLGLGLAPVLAVLALFTALAYPWVARRLGVTEPMVVVKVAAETGRRFLG